MKKRMDDSSGETIARCQTLFEECQEAIAILTREGHVLDVNQACLDLLGYEREEIIGMDSALLLYAGRDDLHRIQSEMERRGSVKDFDMQFRRKDGKPDRLPGYRRHPGETKTASPDIWLSYAT